MKRTFLQLLAIGGMLVTIGVQTATAQWTSNATSVYLIDQTKLVGIGTDAPSYPLDIKQDGNCNFRVQSKVSGSSNMILARALSNKNCLVNYKTGTTQVWNTGCSGDDNFGLYNASNISQFTVLQANGFVGIGTITPTARLEVNGAAKVVGNFQVTNNSTFGASMGVSGNVTATGILSGATVNATGNVNAANFNGSGNIDVSGYVGFGSVEQLTDGGANTIASNSSFVPTIDASRSLGTSALRWANVWASGNVGIGVTTASAKLHVDGGADVAPASGGYAVFGTVAGLNIGFDNNEIMARNNGVTSPLYLQNNGGDLVLCAASGNVTIGTSVPATGYILSVDGKVMAEEVRVELSGSWPDYVFSKEHNLMSIEDLESHVNEFKHLPGIPSATEVAATGISLGEMQVKTIEKVEENSLYVIQLNNKIEQQNLVIAKLIQEIEALKNNK